MLLPAIVLMTLLSKGSILLAADVPPASGFKTNGLTPPVTFTTQQDHEALKQLLQITSLRPGRNGSNPQATHYANYDEAKANPFPSLPDPLLLKNGQPVTTPQQWWEKRRPELVEDFDREIYGRVPKQVPPVHWQVTRTTHETNGDIAVITKQLSGRVDNRSYPFIEVELRASLTTPAKAEGPVPVILQFGFLGPGTSELATNPSAIASDRTLRPFENTNVMVGPRAGGRIGLPATAAAAAPSTLPSWQQQVLAKGWGYAVLSPNSVQADNGAGLTRGIIGLVNQGQPRQVDDWGVLRAWAWGASRLLDYFETVSGVDAKQVGLEGHSRYGKATLVAMAYDTRFAIAYVSSSGLGGAKLHRRDWGEVVENLAGSGGYHWMAGNYLKYAGPLTWGDLPVDAHELVALCAPRPVFLSAGATRGDGWVDAKGTFLAGAGAGPVYRLLGKKDLGTETFPALETELSDGEVAFRQHGGGHTDAPNWPAFLKFAERYLHPANH